MVRVWSWLTLLFLAACTTPAVFTCLDDSSCANGGQAGRCESTGYCSFPDATCTSGRRYGELAPTGLANLCLPPGGDTDSDGVGEGEGEGTGQGEPDPSVCGDGVQEQEEACDSADLAGSTCQSEGFAGGTARCNPDCTLDLTLCTQCGNGSVDPGEACDGTSFADAESCADVGLGEPTEPLGCTEDCRIEF